MKILVLNCGSSSIKYALYNMDDKTVAPFCTHGGSAMGSSESDIRKLCPRACLLKGLPVRGRSVRGAESTVDSWLQSIVF